MITFDVSEFSQEFDAICDRAWNQIGGGAKLKPAKETIEEQNRIMRELKKLALGSGIMTLKEMVKNKTAKFVYYRDKELWYETEDGFLFPIPIADAGTATFNATDKAIFFMRWIRKYIEEQKSWVVEPEACPVSCGCGYAHDGHEAEE